MARRVPHRSSTTWTRREIRVGLVREALLVATFSCVSPIEVPDAPWTEGDRTVLTVLDDGEDPLAVLGGPSFRFAYRQVKAKPFESWVLSWRCDSPGALGLAVDQSARLVPTKVRPPDRALRLTDVEGEPRWEESTEVDEAILERVGLELVGDRGCARMSMEVLAEPIPREEVAFAAETPSGDVLFGSPGLGIYRVYEQGTPTRLTVTATTSVEPLAGFVTESERLFVYSQGGALFEGSLNGDFRWVASNSDWVSCAKKANIGRRVSLVGSPSGDELLVAADDGGVARFSGALGSWERIVPPEPVREGEKCAFEGATALWLGPLRGIVVRDDTSTILALEGGTVTRVELDDIITALWRMDADSTLVGTQFGHVWHLSDSGAMDRWVERTRIGSYVSDFVPWDPGFLLKGQNELVQVVRKDNALLRCEEPAFPGVIGTRFSRRVGRGLVLLPYYGSSGRNPIQRLHPRETEDCEPYLTWVGVNSRE
ncbi:MAG: hypothetical protein HY791_09300 [Deltaproteobacteria bacterium]|nr:hypothetical protein [Deltaproteobacteria bacterium]